MSKSAVIKICAELLTMSPIGPYVEDLRLPCKMGKRNVRHLQAMLDVEDSWRKNLVRKLRQAADNMESDSTANNSQRQKCEH